LPDIQDTSEHSAYTGSKNVSAEPLSTAKPQGRDMKHRRGYLRKAESQEYSVNSIILGLKNKNATGVRNNILKKSTNKDGSGSDAISELSKDGDRKDTSSKARVSFNTSAWPEDRSEKRSVAKNIEQ